MWCHATNRVQRSPPLEYSSRKPDDLVARDPYSFRCHAFLNGPFILTVQCYSQASSLPRPRSGIAYRPPCMFLINHLSSTRTMVFSLGFFLYLVPPLLHLPPEDYRFLLPTPAPVPLDQQHLIPF